MISDTITACRNTLYKIRRMMVTDKPSALYWDPEEAEKDTETYADWAILEKKLVAANHALIKAIVTLENLTELDEVEA